MVFLDAGQCIGYLEGATSIAQNLGTISAIDAIQQPAFARLGYREIELCLVANLPQGRRQRDDRPCAPSVVQHPKYATLLVGGLDESFRPAVGWRDHLYFVDCAHARYSDGHPLSVGIVKHA